MIGNGDWRARTDRLILMFEPSTTTPVERGFYLQNDRILEDPVEDLFRFLQPVEQALIARLQARA